MKVTRLISRKYVIITLTVLGLVSSSAFGLQRETFAQSADAVDAPQGQSGPVPRSLTQEEIEALQLQKLPDIPKLPKIPKIPSASKYYPSTLAADFVRGSNPDADAIPLVQKRIKEVIDFNESLKPQLKNQASELQRITEQARMHKRILKDLEEARQSRFLPVRPDTQELIRQEKVRLIGQETQNNYRYLKNLQHINDAVDES